MFIRIRNPYMIRTWSNQIESKHYCWNQKQIFFFKAWFDLIRTRSNLNTDLKSSNRFRFEQNNFITIRTLFDSNKTIFIQTWFFFVHSKSFDSNKIIFFQTYSNQTTKCFQNCFSVYSNSIKFESMWTKTSIRIHSNNMFKIKQIGFQNFQLLIRVRIYSNEQLIQVF